MEKRRASEQGFFARSGFLDTTQAEILMGLLPSREVFADALSHASDPDQALALLVRLIEADQSVAQTLLVDALLTDRIVAVLGASATLGEHLIRFPGDIALLLGEDLTPAPELFLAAPTWLESANTLRINYRRALLQIAAADLTGTRGFEATSLALSDLADGALDASLLIARQETGIFDTELAVIAMGKCGARELNYISDVDVIFVADDVDGDQLRNATKLATQVMRACHETTSEGSLWEVDAGLRPEGKDGPLVRTIESHTAYYERWAQPWEFQALLKARTAAGSKDVGARFTAMASLGTWSVAEKPTFVDDVRKMRKRVEEHIPSKDAERHLKLGVGGLRDVEFAVQLLQLVHGKADEDLRVQSTMSALRALSAAGYVGREDGAALLEAYSWMRTLEHRIQLNQLKRSHLIPEDESDLRRIARSMAYESSAELLQQWRERRSLVRSIHEKLFFRPLLAAVARLAADEQRLTPEAAQARLLALGYGDPVGALAHIQALTSGVSRRAAIQRQLLPAMLEWFTQGPDPDAGLFGFRQVSDALGDTPWYLRMLRDSGATAQRLALVLSSSRYASELILRAPEATAMLDDDGDLAPRGIEQLILESLSVVRRQDESDKAIESVRAVRRRELFRTAVADLLGTLSVAEVGDALSDVAGATLEAAFDAASRAYVAEHGPLTIKFAVIALGRLGGNEMSYQSDADVLFVHEYLPGTDEKVGTDAAHWIAGEMRRLTSLPNPEPPLIIDPDLRPDGKQGPLVRSLSAYAHYYAEQALLWERQALLRARPIAGDADLGERFIALIDFYRYPTAGISMSNLREMRRLKARVESERLPRGADKSLHLKLGPGGLSDVEWMAQYLQMNYAGKNPRLRITGTLEVLNRAVAANLLTIADAATLSDSWLLATRIRNAVMLVTARHSDEVPKATESARAVSQVLGFASGEALMEEWRRQSRRARAVFERLFYEDGNE